MKNTIIISLAAIVAHLAPTTLSAESIGINFAGASYFIQPNEQPGVAPGSNWNNVMGSSRSDVMLYDSSNALTAALLSFNSTLSSGVGTFYGTNTANLSTNQLYRGGLAGNNNFREVSINLTNIPYLTYDVYVYASQDSHLTNTLSITNGTTTFYYRGSHYTTKFSDSGSLKI